MYKPDNDYSSIRDLLTDFPSSFLENGLNRNSIFDIINYSLYKLAHTVVDCNGENLAEYILKNYYRNFEDYSVNKFIYQLDLKWVGKNSHYEYQSKKEIDELLTIFKTFPELEEECIELYEIAFLLRHLQIMGHVPSILKNGKNLYLKSQLKNPQPMTVVNVRSLIGFMHSELFTKLESH